MVKSYQIGLVREPGQLEWDIRYIGQASALASLVSIFEEILLYHGSIFLALIFFNVFVTFTIMHFQNVFQIEAIYKHSQAAYFLYHQRYISMGWLTYLKM